jgi:iron complex transport system substrate-binding protein
LPALQGNLQHLGKLLGAEVQATQAFATYQQQLDQQKLQITEAQLKQKSPGVLLLIGHAGGKPLIAGKDTAADWLLQRAGGHNLATHTGYKPFSNESLISLDPEVLVFADRALTGDAARVALFKETPILSSTRAAKEGRVLELDPTLLVGGLGPRLPEALKKLSDGFYPGATGQ